MEKTQNYIENPLGTKPIKKLLISFAWPAITANIINAMYSVIDQIFIGQVDQIHQKYIIYDGYLDHYIFVNLEFDIDKKQYEDFIGRIKIIDRYENLPLRYRKLIENGNWEYL